MARLKKLRTNTRPRFSVLGSKMRLSSQEHPSYSLLKHEDHSLVVKINEGFSSNQVLQSFISNNVAVTSFNEILPSLNDIFIELVEGTPAARQFQVVQS